MANIGSLVIEMAANTAKLQSDLGKAVGLAEGAADSIKSAFSKLGAGLLGGGILAAFTEISSHAIEMGDEIAKGASRAGIAGGEFSALAAAAKQADVDIATLSKGLKEIGTTVSSAFSGNASAKKTLGELGLSLTELRGKSASDQLMLVADALNNIPNPSDKARLGTELLGKAYLELVPLLDGGSSAIRDLIAEQTQLGNVMSDEMVAKLSDADSALKQLKSAFSGFATDLAVHVAPAIHLVAATYKELFTDLPEFQRIQDQITSRQIRLNGFLQFDSEATKQRLRDEIAQLQARAASLLTGQIEQSNAQATEAAKKQEEARKAAEAELAAKEALKKVQADIDAFSLDKVNAGITKFFFDYSHSIQQMNADTATSTEKQLADWEDFEKKLKVLVDLGPLNGGIDSTEAQRRLSEYLDNILPDFKPTVKLKMVQPVKEAADEMSEYAKQAAHNIQDAFAQFLFDPFKDGLKGLVTGFLNAIRQMLANAAAARLSEALFGKDGGGGGGLLGGILGAIVGSGAGGVSAASVNAGNNATIDALIAGTRASGGPMSAGKTYLVGERGPEFVTPSRAGFVNPSGSVAAANASDSAVNVHYNIDARGATVDLIARLPEILRQNNDSLRADILQGIRRKKYPI